MLQQYLYHKSAENGIMTAFGFEATRQWALAQGAHTFLSKPFSGEALLAIVTQGPPSEPTPSAARDDHLAS